MVQLGRELDKELAAETSATPPKLSLFSLPSQLPEPPGMLTPPLYTSASVPFLWEEAPGKPRPFLTESKPKCARSLELPPRLLVTTEPNNMPSPTTVLDGPYVGRALPSSFSFRISPAESWVKRPDQISKEKAPGGGLGYFGSKRWGSFRKNKEAVHVSGGFNFSPSTVDGGDGDTKVKITRVSRKGSLLSLYNSRSHNLLENICESFKQVVPWRRRQKDIRKMGATTN